MDNACSVGYSPARPRAGAQRNDREVFGARKHNLKNKLVFLSNASGIFSLQIFWYGEWS